MGDYDVGAPVHITVSFYNLGGNLTDPTTVILKYTRPDTGRTTITTPDARIIKDGIGQYHADLDTTGWVPGNIPYRWEGTGALIAAVDGAFIVKPSPLSP